MARLITDVAAWIKRAPSFHTDQNRIEVRVYAALITTGLALLLLEPIFYLLTVPEALISKVATLVPPSHWVVPLVYCLALVAVLPHLFTLYFMPSMLSRRWPRCMAAWAAFGAGAMWIFMAWKAYPLDYGLLFVAYSVRAVASVSIAVAYAISINAQDLRGHVDSTQD